jgi:hypothetical protein
LVLGSRETEVDRETEEIGISDVGPVQERKEIE